MLKNIHGLKIISSDPKKSMEKSTEIFFFSFRKHSNDNDNDNDTDAKNETDMNSRGRECQW